MSVRCIHACTCQKLDRRTFMQSLFILHRLRLSWGHSDLLLPATMLIYIIKDLALKTLLIQPWLPPVSPAIAERWNNTLWDFQAESPHQETHWAGSANSGHLRCGAAYQLWALTYSNPLVPQRRQTALPCPQKVLRHCSSECHLSSGLTQYISRSIYAVFTAHSTVATSKV